jgi:putative ABC transport system ATP-binding protein
VALIEIRQLTKVYSRGTAAEVTALSGVDLSIERGEYLAITGASGSGKSTLMNLIGCLDTPTTGSYRLDGVDVASLTTEQRAHLRRDKIGFVFQSFQLLHRLTALENVMMPLVYGGTPRGERRDRGLAALASVGLEARAGHRPTELSGGQQQRVAIARALINDPPILLADEPTGALDSKTGAEVLALFARLREAGHTVLLITHDPNVAARAARRCEMRDGELFEATA